MLAIGFPLSSEEIRGGLKAASVRAQLCGIITRAAAPVFARRGEGRRAMIGLGWAAGALSGLPGSLARSVGGTEKGL